jgi:tetratricopeptide (TPR) repeat protein
MTAPTPPDPSALTPADTGRLAALVAAVLADEEPIKRLRQELALLEAEQLPALAAALYEKLLYRIDLRDYWVCHSAWKAYLALGPTRQDAAYLTAALAVQIAPTVFAHPFLEMFRTLRRRGRPAEAVDLFRYQLRHAPEHPAVEPWEFAPVLAEIGQALPQQRRPPTAPDNRRPGFAPRSTASCRMASCRSPPDNGGGRRSRLPNCRTRRC